MASEREVEEDYVSGEDSDFAPDDAPERELSAESDDEAEEPSEGRSAAKRKREAEDGDADNGGFENSGDEAVIEKGKKRRRKATEKEGGVGDEDGGEGGLIKTRSQRAQEKTERKATVVKGPVTIDVHALWAQMTAVQNEPSEEAENQGVNHVEETTGQENTTKKASNNTAQTTNNGVDSGNEEMIKIKRTYNFAGKVHTEEKMVAKDSAEAKLYLASLGENVDPNVDDGPPKRLPRKAFRSVFEPLSDQTLQRADLNLGMTVRLKARELAQENAKKLNTVEKSRMDWAGFVDKEGIKDDLELAGKSKDSFAERQLFLARSEAKREEEARRARLAGKA